MQTIADAVELLHPQLIALAYPSSIFRPVSLKSGTEVDVHLIFWNAACEQLAVAAEHITSIGLLDAVSEVHLVIGHFFPPFFLSSHDISGLHNHRHSSECEDRGHNQIAGQHLFLLELTHLVVSFLVYYFCGTSMIYGGWSAFSSGEMLSRALSILCTLL